MVMNNDYISFTSFTVNLFYSFFLKNKMIENREEMFTFSQGEIKVLWKPTSILFGRPPTNISDERFRSMRVNPASEEPLMKSGSKRRASVMGKTLNCAVFFTLDTEKRMRNFKGNFREWSKEKNRLWNTKTYRDISILYQVFCCIYIGSFGSSDSGCWMTFVSSPTFQMNRTWPLTTSTAIKSRS